MIASFNVLDDEVYVFPMSSHQKRLWLAEKMNNQVSAYNIFRAYIIRGDININCLNKSINRLISRHESLRTRFDVVNNELIQMIYAKVDFKLQVLDLSQKGLDLPNSHITEILREEAQRSFNLDELPLFHAYLIKIKDTEHIFVWNMHHIISDGWSMRVLLKELTCLYNNEIQGEFCNLPEVEIQYADFSEWHREWLETEEAEKQLKYWSDFLSGELPMTQLPGDYSKGNFNFTYKGDSYRETVDLDLFNRTMEFSKKQNVTPFITFLTVFKVLVSRYLEQKDIIIGTPVAGRTASEIENTVGFFVNTLPIRTKLNYDKSFTEILQEVRTVSFNTFENDGIPLQSIIEAINPVRTGGASPIIQSVFTFQESLKEELSFLNLQIEPVIVEDKTAKFELTFVVDRKENDEIDILVEYNTDLFKVDTIKRLVKNYIKALESVLENPQQKIKELEIISESEKRQIIAINSTFTKVKEITIHEFFEKLAIEHSELIAFYQENGTLLSYKELNAQANKLANYLRKKGLQNHSRVAVCLERSSDLLVSILAILKTGAAYVPIDPDYPIKRIEHIIQDSGVQLVISDSKFNINICTNWLYLDEKREEIEKEGDNNLQLDVSESENAYIIYTSGTTGNPKGVRISHNSVINLIMHFNKISPIKAGDKCSFICNHTFDVSVFEIFSALLNGGEIHLVPEKNRYDSSRFFKWLQENEINHIYLPPYIVSEFAELVNTSPTKINHLKRILVGVEPIIENKLRSLKENIKNCDVINAYGPTETTIISTFYEVSNESKFEHRRNTPIGKPIQNTEVYVLDDNLNFVPIGVKGELYIGGMGLSSGYVNSSELNMKKFIDNPYGNGILYKTGDIVKVLPEGNIEFIGRKDNQIKIRGLRVELGEIKSHLVNHPSIRDAEVILLHNEDKKESGMLVAYVIEKDTLSNENELRSYLSDYLPKQLIPQFIIKVDHFPLNSSGKIDRKKLPLPIIKVDDRIDGPVSEIQEKLVSIWSKTLDKKDIGINTNFFEIGGHSLAALQIIVKIKELFNVNLTITKFFNNPTIKDIENEILNLQKMNSNVTGIKKRERTT